MGADQERLLPHQHSRGWEGGGPALPPQLCHQGYNYLFPNKSAQQVGAEPDPSAPGVSLGPCLSLGYRHCFSFQGAISANALWLRTGSQCPRSPHSIGHRRDQPCSRLASEHAEIPMQIPQIALFQPPQSTFFSSPAGTSCSCSWQCRDRSWGWEPLPKPALSKTSMPGGTRHYKTFIPQGRGASGSIFHRCCKERCDGKRGHGSRG